MAFAGVCLEKGCQDINAQTHCGYAIQFDSAVTRLSGVETMDASQYTFQKHGWCSFLSSLSFRTKFNGRLCTHRIKQMLMDSQRLWHELLADDIKMLH